MVKAVAGLFASLVFVAAVVRAQTPVGPPAPPGPPAAPAGWKQIYENNQIGYYISENVSQVGGESDVVVVAEYKIPQVMDGTQIWSIVSHMKVRCDSAQLATVDNTPHALQMGAGRAVPMQAVQGAWHPLQPGSLGELIWKAVCAKK